MSVRRKLLLGLTLIVACTALVGGTGVAGLFGLQVRFEAAEEEYTRLRSLYEVGHRVASARLLLNSESPDVDAAARQMEGAIQEARKLAHRSDALDRDLEEAAQSMAGQGGAANLNRSLSRVASLAGDEERAILENKKAATSDMKRLCTLLAILFVGTLSAAAFIGMALYRAVARPLRTIGRAIAEVERSRYSYRIKVHGDREFRRLMRHFNSMSAAVENLHASMNRQVEIKSRQLIRSEQLAGVGFLAAGMAHEINNPLAIIAGHSQLALRRLSLSGTAVERDEAVQKATSTLEVVCEEAFRCRGIATRLLDLAQPAALEAGTVSLSELVGRAVDLVSVLPMVRERELVFLRTDASITAQGDPQQLLQVLINLLTNALEACPASTGRVVVSLSQDAESASITIIDNGCGMEPETIAHAFDPFFTDKPRRGLSGCGLGLSVSHAIVERHQGRLYAHSEGPGKGSTFVVELPALTRSLHDAHPECIDAAAA